MRNAFIALLVVNLIYFAWAQWVDEPKAPPVNEALAKLPRLKLVSELPADQRPATNTKTALNETPPCMSVGPFGDLTNAAKAAGILTSRGFTPQQRAEEAGTSTGYWVYVGGLKDEVEADRVRVSLEKAGVKDALVMPPGAEAGNDGRAPGGPCHRRAAAAAQGRGCQSPGPRRPLLLSPPRHAGPRVRNAHLQVACKRSRVDQFGVSVSGPGTLARRFRGAGG